MRKLFFSLLLIFTVVYANADNEYSQWTVFPAYHNATKCINVGTKIYVISDGGLYSYDYEDNSVETYTTANVLSDNSIFDILYCQDYNVMVIVYNNGNIDVMDKNEDVYNISDLKLKTLSDKTINSCYAKDNYVYISMNSGIVVVDVNKLVIANFYSFDFNVTSVMVDNNYIYASTTDGVYCGNNDDNLLDFNNWNKVTSTYFKRIFSFNDGYYALARKGLYSVTSLTDFSIKTLLSESYSEYNIINNELYVFNGSFFKKMNEDLSFNTYNDSINYIDYANGTYWAACGENGLRGYSINGEETSVTVGSVIPNSPIRNYSTFLRMTENNRLLIAGGIFSFAGLDFPGTLMKYEDSKFTNFDEEIPIAELGENLYYDITDIVEDPNDTEHHFAGSARDGIYEYRNYKMVNHYDCYNSPLESILPDNARPNYFVRTTGVEYDSKHNLWMLNNQKDTIIHVLKDNGSWVSLYYDEIAKNPSMDHILFDKNGWAWINSRRRTSDGFYAGVFVLNTNGTLENTDDDKQVFLSNFTNQDGTSYSVDFLKCITQDLNGYMWFGTDKGLFMTSNPSSVFNDDFRFYQVKVPRNDGSNLADYLLSGVSINCITIDGGNRKWIGTADNGVYLISSDGLEQIEHFTTENSPLITDNISSIAINGSTGEVFFGSEVGLVSYRSDAASSSETLEKDNVKVYPNPVTPDFTGNIKISGLVSGANVKIVNAAGHLINEGTSSGGMYTWNGKNKGGKKCGSGIYYVLVSDSEGKTGVAQKFAIIK